MERARGKRVATRVRLLISRLSLSRLIGVEDATEVGRRAHLRDDHGNRHAHRHHHRCQPPRRTPRHGRCGKDQEDAGSQVFERAGESEHVAKEEEVGHGEPDDEAP